MDGNQILAAEPGFHSDPPRGGGFEVSAIRRFPDYRSELAEQQSENGLEVQAGRATMAATGISQAKAQRRASEWMRRLQHILLLTPQQIRERSCQAAAR